MIFQIIMTLACALARQSGGASRLPRPFCYFLGAMPKSKERIQRKSPAIAGFLPGGVSIIVKFF
jgi:hypothetical protein